MFEVYFKKKNGEIFSKKFNNTARDKKKMKDMIRKCQHGDNLKYLYTLDYTTLYG